MCVCVYIYIYIYIHTYTHIHITYKVYVTYGIPEGEGTEMGIKNLFDEVIDENLPNLKKEIDIEKALSSLNKMKASRSTPKHIINKRAKVKDVGFSRQQGKIKVCSERTSIRLLADFFTESWQGRREWQDILKILKGGKKKTTT